MLPTCTDFYDLTKGDILHLTLLYSQFRFEFVFLSDASQNGST